MLCALIMAGGRGTRFWPLSTDDKPKQFLKLLGEETMLQMTVNRIKKLIPEDRIFICTGERYIDLVNEQLPGINKENIIIEPQGRNTAPCIALSAWYINRKFKNANMVVLPSDHLIKDENNFRNIIETADKYLIDYFDSIITLGMKPDRPETGYGYIKYENNHQCIGDIKIYDVQKFVEKPSYDKAKMYIQEGSYLWNGGMFIWNINNILNLFKEYLPNTYYALNDIDNVKDEELQQYINDNYSKTDEISIDYGIMEKINGIKVITCDFGWDDVGNWESLERYRNQDVYGNILDGEIKHLEARNNIVLSTNKKVMLYDVENIFFVETDDYIVITNKDRMNNIKSIKEELNIN